MVEKNKGGKIMETNKELKARIWAELKKAGYNSKQIKVSVRYSSYDDCVKFTIEDLTIPKRKIEQIGEMFRSVRYDERSQEILQGCNVFVRVQYNYEKWEENRNRYEEQAKAVMASYNGINSSYIIENDPRFLYHPEVMWVESKNQEYRKSNPRIWDVMELLACYYLGHYESIDEYNEWKAEQAIEEQKRYEENLKQQEISRKQEEIWKLKRQESQRLINEESTIFELKESDQVFMNDARWANCNKNGTLKEYKEECDKGEYYLQGAKITHIWHFETWHAWRALTNGLLTDYEQIKGLGGNYTDDERVNTDENYRKMTSEERKTVKWFNLVILAYFEDKAILIDPQGSSYCRYVALFDGYALEKKAAKEAFQILHEGKYTDKIDQYYQYQ
jgi:hypothetical protein